MDPIRFKPSTAPNGTPTCVPDKAGDFVTWADYSALAEKFARVETKDAAIQKAADEPA
jgi:hypothetical protein